MCYVSSKLLNEKEEQNFTRIQKTPLLGVKQGDFIDFVFFSLIRQNQDVIQNILQASNPHGVTNLTVR